MNREAGFILPMTLVVISILALALWSAMAVLGGMNSDLQNLSAGMRLEMQAQRAEARVAYLMLTEPTGPPGLLVHGRRASQAEEAGVMLPEEDDEGGPPGRARPVESFFWFDDRPYLMDGEADGAPPVVVQLQDDAGLFNVNKIDPEAAQRFFLALGKKDEQARRLGDALADYIDEDEGRRLNGAERPEYSFEKMAPPANRTMREVGEVWNVLHWREMLTPPERARVMELASAGLVFSLSNINTAAPETLMAWFNLTREEADLVVATRRNAPLLSLNDITRITGATPVYEDFRLYNFPSQRVRLRVSEAGGSGRRMFETWITRAHYAADRPYYRGRFGLIEGRKRTAEPEGTDGPSPLPQSERLLPR